MFELAKLHCTPISADTPRLSEADISQYLSRLPDWRITMMEGEARLEKTYKFKDFKAAMEFTDKIARVADDEDHHPALLTEWGKATVTWWTHRIRGLHQNDFIMAAKTENLYGEVGQQAT
jgi:4a-hydroxytetrahydrobiopterin dehydratase